MTEVILHVYDVTNSESDKTNNTIVQINKIFKDRIGLGGIFHSAVQVYGEDEWSFGFCEQGSGVFSCPSGRNPMYAYREPIVLGRTNFSILKVNQILRELSSEWAGSSYELLAKNCNHFCDEFCERLGVPKLPGWVNRFANAGDTAIEIAENTVFRLRQAKTEIVSASKVAYCFLVGVTSGSGVGNDSPGNSNRGIPGFQATWFKNIINAGDKPSIGSELENLKNNSLLKNHPQNSALTMLQLSRSGRPRRRSSEEFDPRIHQIQNNQCERECMAGDGSVYLEHPVRGGTTWKLNSAQPIIVFLPTDICKHPIQQCVLPSHMAIGAVFDC